MDHLLVHSLILLIRCRFFLGCFVSENVLQCITSAKTADFFPIYCYSSYLLKTACSEILKYRFMVKEALKYGCLTRDSAFLSLKQQLLPLLYGSHAHILSVEVFQFPKFWALLRLVPQPVKAFRNHHCSLMLHL